MENKTEKNWLTKYRWTGDETSLPVKAEALKAASEYTLELQGLVKRSLDFLDKLHELAKEERIELGQGEGWLLDHLIDDIEKLDL